MIICVNPGSEDLDETLHVMKFAETAQEVMVTRAKDLEFRLRAFMPTVPQYISPDDTEYLPLFPEGTVDIRDENSIAKLLAAAEDRKRAMKRKGECLLQSLAEFRENLSNVDSDYMLTKQRMDTMSADLEAREHQIKLMESKCAKFERSNDINIRRAQEFEKELDKVQRELDLRTTAE